MNDSGVEQRIFVVGVPRSGTTLVQSLLAAHSRVASFTESHFFSRHFRRLPGSRAVLLRDPAIRVQEFLAENGVDPSRVPAWPALSRWSLALRSRDVARRFLELLDQLARRRGSSVWVEKTPRHLRYVPFLERVSGRLTPTRFVHVVRDGLETVASLYKASRDWERAYDLETCVARWNADVGFSLSRAGSPNDRFVFYEELTARPAAVLAGLLASLGLAWEPEILERHAAGAGRLVTPDETWKAGVGRDVRPSGTSGRVLTGEQREQARRALRHDLYLRLREASSVLIRSPISR